MILELFERERAAGRPLVAAIVVATTGSTYRKPGAWMLFAASGDRAGLLSGGCLEGDLGERAARLLAAGRRLELTSYDSRSSDDPVWGLGLGCEGLMRILLLRVDAASGYQPLAELARLEAVGEAGAWSVALEVERPAAGAGAGRAAAPHAAGEVWLDDRGQAPGITQVLLDGCATVLFVARVPRAPRVLVCGAGPDVEPVVAWGAALGWHLTVVDHRPAYVDAARFPAARAVHRLAADELAHALDLGRFDAALVMSHHLVADGHYLAALANAPVPYVGLLGPAARRERLYAEIGAASATALRPRLRAPVGLDLGGRTPEAIALSIVAEVQAALHGREGAPFSSHLGRPNPEDG
ncbi:MAG: XdhC family protein [Steroidobacteraceae bacterium]|nr:XdhC family protein [Steroidobacteraceae bacterium]